MFLSYTAGEHATHQNAVLSHEGTGLKRIGQYLSGLEIALTDCGTPRSVKT